MNIWKLLCAAVWFALQTPPVYPSPIKLSAKDAITIYYANRDREVFQISIDWTSLPNSRTFDPIVAKLVAPDGRIVDRLEVDQVERGQSIQWIVTDKSPIPGNYRLVWTAFRGDLEINSEPAIPFAFSGHADGLLLPEGASRFYFVVPQGMSELPLLMTQGAFLRELRDEKGTLRYRGENPAPKVLTNVSGHAGEVWSLLITAKGKQASLGFGGSAPLPLASTPEAAKAVGGAFTVEREGAICFFPWQAEAWKLLHEYRKLPTEAYAVPLPELSQFASEWESEPARNSQLFGPNGAYANLRPILAEQNLNPKSPWFGAIHVWRDFKGNERKVHPAQFYRREEAFGKDFRSGKSLLERRNRGGLGVHQAREAANLASIYILKAKFNPLYQNEALLNRIVVALLQDLMMVRPSELLDPTSTGYYGGNRAFHFNRFTETYSLIGPYLPAREKRVIDQAMITLADRYLVGQVGSTTNQWLAIPTGIYHVYLGSGDERYKKWTHQHLKWILNVDPEKDATRAKLEGGLQSAGYHLENGGPDATYNGITLADLALLARELDAPELVASIQRSYFFFNHTIIPHPLHDQKPGYGSFDFSHRTIGSWWAPQWGGGLTYMADLLPEAGLRSRYLSFAMNDLAGATERFHKQFKYNPPDFFNDPTGGASRIAGGRYKVWQFFPKKPLDGILPAEERKEFFRNFGDEFFCIRRGEYYVVIYAGSSLPTGALKRTLSRDNIHAKSPQNGGGISLLWSKAAGPSLIGRNLGAYAAHSLIAKKERKEFRNDYPSTRVLAYQPDDWALSIKGRMAGLPLSYDRTYRFLPDSIEIQLKIFASEDVTLEKFHEVLPLTQEKDFSMEAWVGTKSLKESPLRSVSKIMLKSSQKEKGHQIHLDPPRTARRQLTAWRDSKKPSQHHLNTLHLDLPTVWKANHPRSFTFTISFNEPLLEVESEPHSKDHNVELKETPQ